GRNPRGGGAAFFPVASVAAWPAFLHGGAQSGRQASIRRPYTEEEVASADVACRRCDVASEQTKGLIGEDATITFPAAKRPAPTANQNPEPTPVAMRTVGQPRTATGIAIFHHRPKARPASRRTGITL